jgi:cytochrome P450
VGRRRYEIYGPAFQADPYAVYARMREEAPVVRQPGIDGETPIWFVTRYEDVSAVLLDDRRLVRDPRCVLTPEELAARPPEFTNELIESHMLNRDGDDHRRLRRLVTKAFTPRMVESLRPRIHQIADELIDRVASRGTMDLVEEYAFPLPITVIAELLGVPAADRDRFRTWSATVITPAFGPDASTRFMEQMSQFTGYLADLFARRRAEPRDDLVSFGRGVHYCLGAPLARLEGAIALKTLLRRLPGLRLAVRDDELDYRPTPTFRSLTALPVAWD